MRKLLLIALVFIIFICNRTGITVSANQQVWTGSSSGTFYGGDGSVDSPFLINTPEQFAHIANMTEYEYYYKLESDLILNDLSNYSNWEINPPQNKWQPFDFSGYFDGNGHTIKGVYIKSDYLNVGLFGNVYNGKINNLIISDSYIIGAGNVGGIVGYCQNLNIQNSYNYGAVKVEGLNRAGGIAGRTTGLIEKCYNYGNIQSDTHAAGIVALTENNIDYCYNYGEITAKSAGGIASWVELADAKISNCGNEGNVNGISKDYAFSFTGGILGQGYEIYNCYNKGEIYSNNGETGGIVGVARNAVIKDCVNEGAVDGISSRVGGIIGSISCNDTSIIGNVIENCKNTGNIGNSSDYVGGILGKCGSFDYPLIIKNCYNSGNVECSNNYVGGIAGYLTSGQQISNVFNSGTIIGKSYVGGILGQHAYETDIKQIISVNNCYNSGRVYAESIFGGIAGQLYGKINCSYNSGELNNSGDTTLLGQFIKTTIVQNSYAISTTTDLQNYKLSSQDMLLKENYQNFDFENIWEFKAETEYMYPVLKSCAHRISKTNNLIPVNLIVDSLPNKVVYNAGDILDLSNLSIVCEYSDGNKKDVKYYINKYPYKVAFPSAQNIVLKYCGLTVSIPIIINSDKIADKFNSGNGTIEDPYIITDAKEMGYLAVTVNAGVDDYKDKYVCVNNDIVLNSDKNYNWIPIGTSECPFMGNFNGKNNVISGMYIDNNKDYQGLFGYVLNGRIENIIVADSYVKAKSYVGAITGKNDASNAESIISNCHNCIDVEGENFVGGIVGHNSPSTMWNSKTITDIYDCTNVGDITGYSYVGGIAGWHNSISDDNSAIKNSYNYGTIESSYEFYSYCGGIAGMGRGSIESCINNGNVLGKRYVAGISGSGYIVTDCENYGSIEGESATGGIVGNINEVEYETNNFNYSYVNNILTITDINHKNMTVINENTDYSINCNLTLNNFDKNTEQVLVAVYDKYNRLLYVNTYSNTNDISFNIEKDILKRFIKVFYWGETIQPLTKKLVIPCV